MKMSGRKVTVNNVVHTWSSTLGCLVPDSRPSRAAASGGVAQSIGAVFNGGAAPPTSAFSGANMDLETQSNATIIHNGAVNSSNPFILDDGVGMTSQVQGEAGNRPSAPAASSSPIIPTVSQKNN